MKKAGFFIMVFIIIFIPAPVFSITPQQILQQVEENQNFSTFQAKGRMVIKDRFGERTKTFIVYARGKEETLIEFTSIDEAGQKILRTRDEIYLYYPDAEQIIRLQGAALRDSVAGSDLSYEDLTGGKEFLEIYKVTLKGEESVHGKPCYLLELKAKKRNVPYPEQLIWVDKSTFSVQKARYFSLSGKLIKEIEVKKVEKIKTHYLPTHYIFYDMLKKDSRTEFFISDIEVDARLSDKFFSLEELSW